MAQSTLATQPVGMLQCIKAIQTSNSQTTMTGVSSDNKGILLATFTDSQLFYSQSSFYFKNYWRDEIMKTATLATLTIS